MSLSGQELETAGSSGARGCVEEIVRLKSCVRVLVGSQGCAKRRHITGRS